MKARSYKLTNTATGAVLELSEAERDNVLNVIIEAMDEAEKEQHLKANVWIRVQNAHRSDVIAGMTADEFAAKCAAGHTGIRKPLTAESVKQAIFAGVISPADIMAMLKNMA